MDFLNQNFDKVYSPFDEQVQRLRKVGDQNTLISAMKVFETAKSANEKALALTSNAAKPPMFSLIRSTEQRVRKLDQLVNEANQCKSKTNSCLAELRTAMSEAKVNLNEVKDLEAQISDFLLEVKALKSYFESTLAREYDPTESDSALRAINSMISKVEDTLMLTKNVISVNRANLISALSFQEEFDLLNQSIKEMAASGPSLGKLTVDGTSYSVTAAATKTEPSKMNLAQQHFSHMMEKRKVTSRKLLAELKKYKSVLIATAVIGTSGAGLGTYIHHQNEVFQKNEAIYQVKRTRIPQFYKAVDIAKDLSNYDHMGYSGDTGAIRSIAMFKIYEQYSKIIDVDDFNYMISD